MAAKTQKSNTKSKAKSKAKATRPTATKRKTTKGKRGKNAKIIKLADWLPESATRIEPLTRAVKAFDKGETSKELNAALKKLIGAYEDVLARLSGLEENTRHVAEERLEEVRERLFALEAIEQLTELQESLGDRATDELDTVLSRLGLMRVAKHEEELEKAKKRAKASAKAALTRKLKKEQAAKAA